MEVLDEKQYKQILKNYKACFDGLFSDIVCVCEEEEFFINRWSWKYSEISGVDCTPDSFIIELNECSRLYLPITDSSKFHITSIKAKTKALT